MGGISNNSLNENLKQPNKWLFMTAFLEGAIYDPTTVYAVPYHDIDKAVYSTCMFQPVDKDILRIWDIGLTVNQNIGAECRVLFGRIRNGVTVADFFGTYTIPAGTTYGITISRMRANFDWGAAARETDGVVRLRPGDILICQSPACVDGYGAPADGVFTPFAHLVYDNHDRNRAADI